MVIIKDVRYPKRVFLTPAKRFRVVGRLEVWNSNNSLLNLVAPRNNENCNTMYIVAFTLVLTTDTRWNQQNILPNIIYIY